MEPLKPEEIPVGVVGLGMMGCSIAACLAMAGHPVIAIAPIPADLKRAFPTIYGHLEKSHEEGLIQKTADQLAGNLTISEDYTLLAPCKLVIECTIEDPVIKQTVYGLIEQQVGEETLITSNTSAIPISTLQEYIKVPTRFFGLHWAEPSHTTRFLEIICGKQSDISKGEWLYALSHCWGKEATLVRKDIRGFITNRLMYALYREAFFLVENGYASIEDIDRACRNNAGYWMTLMGPFRWMDVTGVYAYHEVMKDLFPTLNNQTHVPQLIDDVVKAGGKGVVNAKGFYPYTPEAAKAWKEVFEEFSYEIRRLALKYPANVVEQRVASKDEQQS